MDRKTKIICTIGPASSNEKVVSDLLENGMNVARLNFSHGTHETHLEAIKLLRKVASKKNKNLGILMDTKGPEIRTGEFENGKVLYQKNQMVKITLDKVLGNTDEFQINCPELFKDTKVGDYILVDDGKMRFDITKKESNVLITKNHHEGYISNHKSCNVPNCKVSIPFLSQKDIDDIVFSCKQDVDIIALSFVRSAKDIMDVREILKKEGKEKIQIIAKIENEQGVSNLDEILEVTDGIMVARGDLGVEVSLQLVPIYQKKIIKRANEFGKPVVTATHMLESMINNPRPTRAEASDVANAILDGSDAIMLSGESAMGQFPIEAVTTMDTIAREIEKIIPYEDNLQKSLLSSEKTVNDAIGIAVSQSALTLPTVEAVVAFTETGGTARRICKFRPSVPVIAITNSESTARKLSYYFDVFPVIRKGVNNLMKYDEEAISVCKELGFKSGATVIITSGYGQEHGRTNTIRFIEIP